jgi:hypothetical protein
MAAERPDLPPIVQSPPDHLDALVELYCALLTKSSQEGDGIWSRFNVMVGINAGLVAAFAFVFQTDKPALSFQRQNMMLVICVMGITASIWSFHVLLRLWGWQQYWRDRLRQVESVFPDTPGWVRSFTPEGERVLLTTDPGVKRSLWFGYTQPFMAMFLLAWIALLVIAVFP